MKWDMKGGYLAHYQENKPKELGRFLKHFNITEELIRELQETDDRDDQRAILLEHQVGGSFLDGLLNREQYLIIVEDISMEILKHRGKPYLERKDIFETKKKEPRKETPLRNIKRMRKGKVYYASKPVKRTRMEEIAINIWVKEGKKPKEMYERFMKIDGRYKLNARTEQSFKTLWSRVKRGK